MSASVGVTNGSCCYCRGGLRTIMITGDYHHTAIAVAKNVGMLRADRDIVVIDAVQQCQTSPPSPPRRVACVSPSPDQSPAPLHHSPSSRLRSTSLRSALVSPGHAAASPAGSSSFCKPHSATQAVPEYHVYFCTCCVCVFLLHLFPCVSEMCMWVSL